MKSRIVGTGRALPALLACLVLAASSAAQEPSWRLTKAGGEIVAELEPDAGLPEPSFWHVYRGSLINVDVWIHRGDPDGLCLVPGTERQVELPGDLDEPGDFYYLLSTLDRSEH